MSAFDRLHAEGWTQGWEAGREEGRVRLLRQLAHRFGELPPRVKARVLAATPEQIDDWSLRLLTAASLTEALGEP